MDARIVEVLNSLVGRSAALDGIARVLVSDYFAPVTGSLFLLGLWFAGSGTPARFRNQLATMAGALAVGGANLSTSIVNDFYFRPRPFADMDVRPLFYQPTDSSFPSNGAAVGFALAAALFAYHRRLGLAMGVIALAWVLARVYAGVHYPTDVLAGAGIGVVNGLAALILVRLLVVIPRAVLAVARWVVMA